jgi:hypothetical protein
MTKSIIFFGGLVITLILFSACKKTDATPPPKPDPCLGVTITPVANKTATITAQALGTITITAPIGSGYLYSIGSGFQSSVNFFNLTAGNYTITAKNADSCKGTATVAIIDYGPKFYAVRNLVSNNCGPCHLNGTISGGKNFDADATIVSSWDRIQARAVSGTPSFMPQGGQLTALDKQKITDWITAGHKTTD